MPSDVTELLEPWLDLPIRGKTYRFDAVDIETGLWCTEIHRIATIQRAGGELTEADAQRLHLDDDEERDFVERLLGDTYAQVVADKVPWEYVKLVSRVMFTWTIYNREQALELWERGGRPEAPPAPPADPQTEDQ